MNRSEIFDVILKEGIKTELFNCQKAINNYKPKDYESVLNDIISEITDRNWGRLSKSNDIVHHIILNYKAKVVVRTFPEKPYSDFVANESLNIISTKIRISRNRFIEICITAIITGLITWFFTKC